MHPSFVHSNQIISGWQFLAHKSFENCLATTHLVSSLPTYLSAIRTTYSSFHSNGMVSNKSPQSENKCEQSGDTFLSPPSSWLGPIWHRAAHCPDGGHFSAPALARLCQGPECQFSSENLLAGRELPGLHHLPCSWQPGYVETRARARAGWGGRQILDLQEKGNYWRSELTCVTFGELLEVSGFQFSHL